MNIDTAKIQDLTGKKFDAVRLNRMMSAVAEEMIATGATSADDMGRIMKRHVEELRALMEDAAKMAVLKKNMSSHVYDRCNA